MNHPSRDRVAFQWAGRLYDQRWRLKPHTLVGANPDSIQFEFYTEKKQLCPVNEKATPSAQPPACIIGELLSLKTLASYPIARYNFFMPITFKPQPLPLATDESGIVRVSKTRVTLDTIVGAFQRGETPEQIAQNYDSVPLEDIYQIIGFYLNHLDEVNAYIEVGTNAANKLRAENQSRHPIAGIRDRLLARRLANQIAGAST